VLLVFCVHAAGNAGTFFLGRNFDLASFASLSTPGERLLFWLYRSHHGVFLFFVLSGFLIGKLWWPRPTSSYARFALRRTLRIYPAFLVAFAASIPFAQLTSAWRPPDWPLLAANLLFLNGAPGATIRGLNTVTWSLFYEMTFYLAFPLLLTAFVRRWPSRARWLAWIGIGVPLLAAVGGGDTLYLCWSLLFCGVAVALHESAWRNACRRIPAAAVVLAYLAVTTAAMLDVLSPLVAILQFGAVTALLLGKCLGGGQWLARLFASQPMVALGRISYSFYLVHFMIVVLLANALAQHRGSTSILVQTLTVFAAGFVASSIAATALWFVAERPYFRLGRQRPASA